MKLSYGNSSVVYYQAQAIMQLLETQGGVWTLRVRDVPIWWFVRNRFYNQLVNYFNNEQRKEMPTNNKSSSRNIFHCLSACYKCGIFSARSLVGMMRMRSAKKDQSKDQIMFLSTPSAFRGAREKETSDIYFDPIYNKIPAKAFIVERTTLSKWDFYSLLFRKDIIPFDWMMLLALLKLSPSLWKAPDIKGLGSLCNKCQGIDFDSISSEQLFNMIKSVIDRFSRKAIVQVEASKMLLQRMNPKVIVETCSYDSGPMAMNLVARRQGIPIVELQHGLISRSHAGYAYFLPADYQGELPLPNKMLVYGEVFKKAIIEAGDAFNAGMIVVTGFPRMARFMGRVEREGRDTIRRETRRRLSLGYRQFVVVATMQPTTSSCLSAFLGRALKELSGMDVVLCIKPHPSELGTWQSSYSDLLADPHVRVVFDKDVDLYELLIASDIHVTVYSTVFLESFALGAPNILVNCPGYEYAFELVNQDEVLFAETPEAFAVLVKKIAESPDLRGEIIERGKCTARRFFSTDGDPESNIVSAIESALTDMDEQEAENWN